MPAPVADEELYRQFPEPWTQLRLSWLRGKIAAGRGEVAVAVAERWFLETREGFVREGIGYDAAMVSLDLALLYLKDGRTGDVRRLAEEMVTIFEAQDVHREAMAAVEAVKTRSLTRTLRRSKIVKVQVPLKEIM